MNWTRIDDFFQRDIILEQQVSVVFNLLTERTGRFITNSPSLLYRSTHFTQTDDNRRAAEVTADAAYRSPGVFMVSFNCLRIGPQNTPCNIPHQVGNLT